MIRQIDERHDAIVKFEDGWYGRRPLQQSDLSGIHIDPVPSWVADKRIKNDEGEWVAADLLTEPLNEATIERLGLKPDQAERINAEIIESQRKKGVTMANGEIRVYPPTGHNEHRLRAFKEAIERTATRYGVNSAGLLRQTNPKFGFGFVGPRTQYLWNVFVGLLDVGQLRDGPAEYFIRKDFHLWMEARFGVGAKELDEAKHEPYEDRDREYLWQVYLRAVRFRKDYPNE